MILSSSSWIILSHIVSALAVSIYDINGDSCSKHDTCDSKSKTITCSCEENCHVYGTCCADIHNSWEHSPMEPFACYNRRTVTPVFVRRSCPDSFRGHLGIKYACLDDDEDEMDVKNNLLVTSHKTKVTYWNSNCATCNHESPDDLELWNIEVFCPKQKNVTKYLIRQNLTFDQEKKQWGLQIDDDFLSCAVKYTPPPYIDEVRHCTQNLISSCPEEYSGSEIIKKCSKYYAERKLKKSEVYYKNIHCAICNDVNIKQLECPGISNPGDPPEEAEFRQLVKELFMQGNWLEREPHRVFECSPGYAYDPFQTRCRRDRSLDKIVEVVYNSSEAFQKSPLTMLLLLLLLSIILRKVF